MKVYSTLLVLAQSGNDIYIITSNIDSECVIPRYKLDDSTDDSLTLVKNGFSCITGIQKWPIYIKQSGIFEQVIKDEKEINILNTILMPELHTKLTNSWKWTNLKDVSENSYNYNLIRYGVINAR